MSLTISLPKQHLNNVKIYLDTVQMGAYLNAVQMKSGHPRGRPTKTKEPVMTKTFTRFLDRSAGALMIALSLALGAGVALIGA
jgi:hypothetical protein